jgi:outer membrane lipoprotein SlyB
VSSDRLQSAVVYRKGKIINKEIGMMFRSGVLFVLFVALSSTSLEAQSFRQLGTRRGAVAGAVIGGLIGGQNDEVAAGIIAGGLIGGVAGRAVGNRMDYQSANRYRGSYHQGQSAYVQPQYSGRQYGHSQYYGNGQSQFSQSQFGNSTYGRGTTFQQGINSQQYRQQYQPSHGGGQVFAPQPQYNNLQSAPAYTPHNGHSVLQHTAPNQHYRGW